MFLNSAVKLFQQYHGGQYKIESGPHKPLNESIHTIEEQWFNQFTEQDN